MDDRALGQLFHRQLETQITGDNHPDDSVHDEQVGRAIRMAIESHDPERAVREYNDWAVLAGYEPVIYLGTFDGRVRANIKTAIIEVDEAFNIHVLEIPS